jgi:hypothetical protein
MRVAITMHQRVQEEWVGVAANIPSGTVKAIYHYEFGIASRLQAERVSLPDALRRSRLYWSIKAHQCAIQQTPKCNPEYHVLLHSLALSLHLTFNMTGEKPYLRDAIYIAESALKLTDYQQDRQMVDKGRLSLQQICTYDTYDNLVERSIELHHHASSGESLDDLSDDDCSSSIVDDGAGDDGRTIYDFDSAGIKHWWRKHMG